MSKEQYHEFLQQAPQDNFSEDFIQFLRDNNKIIEETSKWLIIQNIKNPKDYTAFYIGVGLDNPLIALSDLSHLHKNYSDREWKVKAPHKRSIKLFHCHLIQK